MMPIVGLFLAILGFSNVNLRFLAHFHELQRKTSLVEDHSHKVTFRKNNASDHHLNMLHTVYGQQKQRQQQQQPLMLQ